MCGRSCARDAAQNGFAALTERTALRLETWNDWLQRTPRERVARAPEVVLDFPVSRRVRPQAQTVPGMISGVVPLVLKASPGSAVAGFCEHVDTRMREALQHQRFPVQVIENKARLRGSGQASNRVVVNFIPSTRLADFAGAAGSG